MSKKFCKSLLTGVMAGLLTLTSCTTAAATEKKTVLAFADIQDHWGRSAIEYCLERRYMTGQNAHAFDPNGAVTRAQVVQVLYNLAGKPDTAGMSCPFLDIEGHWAEKAIIWAYNADMVRGIGGQAFAPNAAVIREQVAVMFRSYQAYVLGKTVDADRSYLTRFADQGLVSSWALDGVSWAAQYGLMSGTNPDVFSPKRTCVRAELAQIVKNYCEPEQFQALSGPTSDTPIPPEAVADQPNSPLVSYTLLSPHHSGRRKHKIDTISIHCMAEDWTVEQCGECFANPNRAASSNYGVGSDGRIALYVDERNRSWCTSSEENDQRAVTIEVSNIGAGPLWPVSDQAYAALIDLLTDICYRNEIKQLLWKGDKSLIGQVDRQNMTVHRWFSSKSCPGEFLYNHHGDIAARVNRRLAAMETANALQSGLAAAQLERS